MKRHYLLGLCLFFFGASSGFAAGVNDAAPSFELADLGHVKKTSADFKQSVVLVNFWATWCPPCNLEFPKLNQLAASYAGKDVKIVAISVDKDDANVQRFIRKVAKDAPLALLVLRDPAGKTADAYKVEAMPTSFVVDKKGVVRYVHMGFEKTDEAKWRQEIDALLAGK